MNTQPFSQTCQKIEEITLEKITLEKIKISFEKITDGKLFLHQLVYTYKIFRSISRTISKCLFMYRYIQQ